MQPTDLNVARCSTAASLWVFPVPFPQNQTLWPCIPVLHGDNKKHISDTSKCSEDATELCQKMNDGVFVTTSCSSVAHRGSLSSNNSKYFKLHHRPSTFSLPNSWQIALDVLETAHTRYYQSNQSAWFVVQSSDWRLAGGGGSLDRPGSATYEVSDPTLKLFVPEDNLWDVTEQSEAPAVAAAAGASGFIFQVLSGGQLFASSIVSRQHVKQRVRAESTAPRCRWKSVTDGSRLFPAED